MSDFIEWLADFNAEHWSAFWSGVSAVIGGILLYAVIRTLIVYKNILCETRNQVKEARNQVNEMRNQVAEAKKSSQGDLYFQIFRLLNEGRESRAKIFELLAVGSYPTIVSEEFWKSPRGVALKIDAEIVAGAYNVAGILAEHELTFRDIVIREWGPSAEKAHRVLASFVAMQRQERFPPPGGQDLWHGFDYLVQEYQKRRTALTDEGDGVPVRPLSTQWTRPIQPVMADEELAFPNKPPGQP